MKRCVCLSLILLLGMVHYSTGADPHTTGTTPTTLASTNPTSQSNAASASPDSTTGAPTTGNSTTVPLSSSTDPVNVTSPTETTTQSTPAANSNTSTATTANKSDSSAMTQVASTSPGVTPPPTTQPITTPPPTTQPITTTLSTIPPTTQPITTSPAGVSSNVTGSTPAVTDSTSAQTSTPVPSTSPAPVVSGVAISETNLLLDTQGLFVELKGSPNGSLSGLTLVVFNGTSAEVKFITHFNETTAFLASGFWIQPIDHKKVELLMTVMIALYQTKDYNSSVPYKHIQDFLVFSTNSSHAINAKLNETLLTLDKSVTIVKTGMSPTQNLSLSRCGPNTTQNDFSQFVPATQSAGKSNACELTLNNTLWTLELHRQKDICQQDMTHSREMGHRLVNRLVGEINRRCRCGLTTLLVQVVGNLSCMQNLFMDFKVQESYLGQTEQVIDTFVNLAREKAPFRVDGEDYSMMNCTADCQKISPHHPPSKTDKDNSTVTVAVVVSCVAVFLIILVSVILYMRGKRRGIIRQFRMTRLQEDDDMDDMEDFIGGGASFTANRS